MGNGYKEQFHALVRRSLSCVMTVTIVATTAVMVHAQNSDGKKQDSKPAVEFGFEERFRSESWNNTDANSTTDDRRQQFRLRTRTWATVSLPKQMTFAVGLVNEFKKQPTPELKFNGDEVLLETLYVDVEKLFVPGLSARIGRQNLSRGEGFVLMDGTPGDGSRTFYTNAIDVAYTRGNSKLELLLIDNPTRDRLLPVGNDLGKCVNDWDTKAIGVYYTGRQRKNADVDAYYFYASEAHDFREVTNPQYQPERRVQMLGGRLVRRLQHQVTAAGEFAWQWGKQAPGAEIKAWGGYAWLKKGFERPGKPYVLGGYWAMSGDDPKTANTNEGWDPLFSRWPKWSDLYVYCLAREKGVGYWSNLLMWQAEVGASPWKRVSVRGTVYGMSAQHARAGTVFGTGTGRGLLAQARTDVQLSERLKGHVSYERLLAGNFYAGTTPAFYLRAELSWQMKWRMGSGKNTP